MLHRLLKVCTKSLSEVLAGIVERTSLVGAASPSGHSRTNHCGGLGLPSLALDVVRNVRAPAALAVLRPRLWDVELEIDASGDAPVLVFYQWVENSAVAVEVSLTDEEQMIYEEEASIEKLIERVAVRLLR